MPHQYLSTPNPLFPSAGGTDQPTSSFQNPPPCLHKWTLLTIRAIKLPMKKGVFSKLPVTYTNRLAWPTRDSCDHRMYGKFTRQRLGAEPAMPCQRSRRRCCILFKQIVKIKSSLNFANSSSHINIRHDNQSVRRVDELVCIRVQRELWPSAYQNTPKCSV